MSLSSADYYFFNKLIDIFNIIVFKETFSVMLKLPF